MKRGRNRKRKQLPLLLLTATVTVFLQQPYLKMQIDAITLALFISSYYQYFGVAALKRSSISKRLPSATRQRR